MSLSVSSLKKRLEQLEQVYLSRPAMGSQITFQELEFLVAFRQQYESCYDSAPLFLRREAERYDRFLRQLERQDESLGTRES